MNDFKFVNKQNFEEPNLSSIENQNLIEEQQKSFSQINNL